MTTTPNGRPDGRPAKILKKRPANEDGWPQYVCDVSCSEPGCEEITEGVMLHETDLAAIEGGVAFWCPGHTKTRAGKPRLNPMTTLEAEIFTVIGLLVKSSDRLKLSPDDKESLERSSRFLMEHDSDPLVRGVLMRLKDSGTLSTGLREELEKRYPTE
jgi:hypothetical protein